MIDINVIDNCISGSVGETPFMVEYDANVYQELSYIADLANNANTKEEYQIHTDKFFSVINRVKDYAKIAETKCPYIKVNNVTGQFFLTYEGEVSKIPMPAELVDRIYNSMDSGADFMPLVKLWMRWLRNPVLKAKMENGTGKEFSDRFFNFVNMKYVHPELLTDLMDNHGLSLDAARKRATIYQIKITKEGLLNGYKVSREIMHMFDPESGESIPRYKRTFDVNTGQIASEGLPEFVEDRIFEPAVMSSGGDPFTCEGVNGFSDPGHFIKVGCLHSLKSWDKVNTDDHRSCVPGLHIGGLYYISGYGGEIHNIFVDPMHVGAVPDDETGAIRCLQYFVHSSLAGVNGSIYHSSTYAAMTDLEWEEMRKDVVIELNNHLGNALTSRLSDYKGELEDDEYGDYEDGSYDDMDN